MRNKHKNVPRAIMLVKFKGPYCNKIQGKCTLPTMVGSKNKEFLFFAFYKFFVFLQKIGSKKQKKNVDSKRMLILQFICKGFVIILKVLLKKWNVNMIFGDF